MRSIISSCDLQVRHRLLLHLQLGIFSERLQMHCANRGGCLNSNESTKQDLNANQAFR
jgi:hypothetical protein